MTAHFSLQPEAVAFVDADNKNAILTKMAQHFAAVYDLDAEAVLERLEERENLGSTGFGRGVAIPHARIDGLSRPVAAFFRLEEPVEYASADGMPVDLVFGLLSPANAGVSHLHALAEISRLVRDDATHDLLLKATDPDALYSLLSNSQDRDAA